VSHRYLAVKRDYWIYDNKEKEYRNEATIIKTSNLESRNIISVKIIEEKIVPNKR
jgi:hypothetical protein